MLKVPALVNVLFVVVVRKVTGNVLVEVSVIVAPGLLVNVTGVTPLPASVTRPEPLIFSAPKLSQLLSVSVAVPVTFVVAVAPVVSSPDPVTTPPLQLKVPFTVGAPVPCKVPLDKFRFCSVVKPLKLTVAPPIFPGMLAVTGVFSETVPALNVALPVPARLSAAAVRLTPPENAMFLVVPAVVRVKLSSLVLALNPPMVSTLIVPLVVASEMFWPLPAALRTYLLVNRLPPAVVSSRNIPPVVAVAVTTPVP